MKMIGNYGFRLFLNKLHRQRPRRLSQPIAYSSEFDDNWCEYSSFSVLLVLICEFDGWQNRFLFLTSPLFSQLSHTQRAFITLLLNDFLSRSIILGPLLERFWPFPTGPPTIAPLCQDFQSPAFQTWLCLISSASAVSQTCWISWTHDTEAARLSLMLSLPSGIKMVTET